MTMCKVHEHIIIDSRIFFSCSTNLHSAFVGMYFEAVFDYETLLYFQFIGMNSRMKYSFLPERFCRNILT